MTTYIARIQLTKGTNDMYVQLRDKLIGIGFTKRIKNNKGVEYRLPNGDYLIKTELKIDTLLNTVHKIALTIDKTPMVLIHEIIEDGSAWTGLVKC